MVLNERFYSVDNKGRTLNDKKQPISNTMPGWKPGYIGYYYNLQNGKDDDNARRVWVRKFDDFNYKDKFEDAVKAKGSAAELAYKYNIMPFDSKEQSRVDWLSLDSWYNEHNFFYVTGLPKYEDKIVAFQLRISNHWVNPVQWLRSHMKRSITGKANGKPQMAQFGLNLMVGRGELNRKTQQDTNINDYDEIQMYNKYGMTLYECDLDLNDKTDEQKKMIATFLTNVGKGTPFTISFKELEYMFGKFPMPSEYGGFEYDPINFSQRPAIKNRNGNPYPWKEKIEQQAKTIKLSDLIELTSTGEVKNIDGTTYTFFKYGNEYLAYDNQSEKVYKRQVRRGVPTDKVLKNEEYEVLMENIMKFTNDDLIYMINECVRKIKRGLI